MFHFNATLVMSDMLKVVITAQCVVTLSDVRQVNDVKAAAAVVGLQQSSAGSEMQRCGTLVSDH